MSNGRIVASKNGPIGRLVFDNEARRNAISIEMAMHLPDILADFAADPDIHLVVLTGAGDKSFISGSDISQFDKKRATPEMAKEYAVRSRKTYEDLRNFPKPTVAGIRGYCFGGGVAIAVACDLRFAADDAIFSIPSARLGIGYRADFTSWVVEAVGPANAKEMLITAQRYNAAEAHRMGLVHRVTPVAEFETAFAAYCANIAENAPLAMRASKAIVNQVAGGLADADLDLCRQLSEACSASEDYAEGRKAFMEKRRPIFRGR